MWTTRARLLYDIVNLARVEGDVPVEFVLDAVSSEMRRVEKRRNYKNGLCSFVRRSSSNRSCGALTWPGRIGSELERCQDEGDTSRLVGTGRLSTPSLSRVSELPYINGACNACRATCDRVKVPSHRYRFRRWGWRISTDGYSSPRGFPSSYYPSVDRGPACII